MGQMISTVLSVVKHYVNPMQEIQSNTLLFKKMSEKAIAPARGSAQAAGYDLFSASDTVIPAYGKALIKTDIAIALPPDCYGRIAPR